MVTPAVLPPVSRDTINTLMNVCPKFRPPLDPDFVSPALWNRAYRAAVRDAGGGDPLAIALERSDGSISTFRTAVIPNETALTHRYVERLLKFLLWQKGGCRVTVGGSPELADYLRGVYSAAGARAFDHRFMGEQIYGRPFAVETSTFDNTP